MKTNNYIVYCHICPNGKKYYGMTSQEPKVRWQYGNGYKDNIEFYEAIQLYEWKNIEHSIIADNLIKEEAELLEEQLILEYKTYDSQYGYNKLIGRKYTEETKIVLSEAHKGKPLSEEHKKRMSEGRKGKYTGKEHSQSKSIICTTTNMVFDCVKDAVNHYGIDRRNISKCCNGKRNYCGKLSDGTKLIWRYLTIIEL